MSRQLFNYYQKTNLKTSADITEITPIYWNKLYPGEKIENLTYKNLTRMITPILPTMDCPYIDLFAFAVPKRIIIPYANYINPDYKGYCAPLNQTLIQNLFERSNSSINLTNALKWYGNQNPTSKKIIPHPLSCDWSSSLFAKFGFSYEKLPFTSLTTTDKKEFDLMHAFAYHKIYFDFFRQKQLETVDYYSWISKMVFDLQREYPSPSAGTYDNSYPVFEGMSSNRYSNVDWSVLSTEQGSPSYLMSYFTRLHTCNVDNDFLNDLTFKKVDSQFGEDGSPLDWNNFKINVFNKFIDNDKIINQIDYGTQKDVLLKIWNTDNKDKTSAQLIGYDRYTQGIRQVVNQAKGPNDTAGNYSQALGEVGGMSMTQNGGQIIREFTATEETYIMVLAVPNYKMAINNLNYSNEWINDSTAKPFNPEMEYIQEPFNAYSIFAPRDSSVDKNTILAYQKPFNYLRFKNDIVAGAIGTEWRNWTYSIDIPSLNEFNLNVLKAQKAPFKNTLISPTQDAFIMEWEFNTNLKRVIKPEFMLERDIVKGE